MKHPQNDFDLTWNNAIMTPVGWNTQTAGNNYLGLNPTMQSKSNPFGKYISAKPTYISAGNMDFKKPLKASPSDDSLKAGPRYEFDQFSLFGDKLSAHDIAKYKDMLNPQGAKQVAFKQHELYGYSELVK